MGFWEWFITVFSVLAMIILVVIIRLAIEQNLEEIKRKKQEKWDTAHDPSKMVFSRRD